MTQVLMLVGGGLAVLVIGIIVGYSWGFVQAWDQGVVFGRQDVMGRIAKASGRPVDFDIEELPKP